MNKKCDYLGEILTVTEMMLEMCFPERFQKFVINNYINAEINSNQNESKTKSNKS